MRVKNKHSSLIFYFSYKIENKLDITYYTNLTYIFALKPKIISV